MASDRYQCVVVVNGLLAFFALHLQATQAAGDCPIPGTQGSFHPRFASVELSCPNERTLIVNPAGGYVTHPFDALYYSQAKSLPVGHRVQLSDLTVEVLAPTSDGRPDRIAYQFRVPLGHPSLSWFFWQDRRCEPWTPPPTKQSLALPPVVVSLEKPSRALQEPRLRSAPGRAERHAQAVQGGRKS